MQQVFIETDDGCVLHAVRDGAGPPVILCHGFPDFWRGWQAQLAALSASFTVVAPDGRGCNLSGKPAAVGAYRLERLVADLDSVIGEMAGGRPPLLVGHDWGGAVAWAYACRHPERLAGLAVLCAPHPAILQQALRDDPAQREASAYMARLRGAGAEAALEADDRAVLRAMLDRLRAQGLSNAEDEAAYLAAWSRPGALTGALNWYRANPLDGEDPIAPLTPLALPTLLLWGAEDTALLPSLVERHRVFAANLEIEIAQGAGHWLQREQPAWVNERLEAFARRVFSPSPNEENSL